MAKRNRYKEMERRMCMILIVCAVLFILYLIAAGSGILWLKVLTSLLVILTSIVSLVFLYLTRELLKPRSLWMSTSFFSLLLCTLASLILAFP